MKIYCSTCGYRLSFLESEYGHTRCAVCRARDAALVAYNGTPVVSGGQGRTPEELRGSLTAIEVACVIGGLGLLVLAMLSVL